MCLEPDLDYNDLPTCTDCGTVKGSGHMNWCPRRGPSCDEYYGPSINEQTPKTSKPQ